MEPRIPTGAAPESAEGEVVRRMEARDVERVAQLEAESFSSPWKADTFRKLLERPGAELLVVEIDDRLVAYAVLWCILDQGELANIAVDPGWRGRGLGGRLLDIVLDTARSRGVKDLFLEVREGNHVARELYRRRGFESIGTRRDYYEHPREDARVLRIRL